MQIYDMDGVERGWDWVHQKFGPVTVSRSETQTPYQVTELREVEGPTDLSVYVRDEDGITKPIVKVAFYWPDAPLDEGAHPEYGRCVTGHTNATGRCGFAMGGGSYYWPPQSGPHAVWLYGDQLSEVVDGLGMLGQTNHVHLNVVYQQVPESPGPEPEPTPDPEPEFWPMLFERLDRIIELLKQM